MTRVARTSALAALSVAALTALVACSPPSEKASSGPLPTSHEELVAQAQEEGSVSLGAGGHTDAQAKLLADEFEEEYGIEVEFLRENGGDITQKLEAQLTAGNLTFDVISLNDTATLEDFASSDVITDAAIDNTADILGPIRPDDASYVPFTWAALGYSYNDTAVEEASLPATWDDLAAASEVKVLADPAASGAALMFTAVLHETAPDFYTGLAEGGDVLTSDSALSLGQTVLTGEATYGLPGIEHDVATARAAGEPLAMAYPEGPIGALASYMAPLADASHPAAARLLVQFAMSPEFQEAQREIGSRSSLADVAVPEGIEAIPEDRMVVIDHAQLAEGSEQLISDFDAAVGR